MATTTAHQWHKLNSLLDELIQIHTQSLGVKMGSTDKAEILTSLAKLPGFLQPILEKYDEGKALKFQTGSLQIDLYNVLNQSFDCVKALTQARSGWAQAHEILALFGFTNTFLQNLFSALIADMTHVQQLAAGPAEKKMRTLFEILTYVVKDAKDSDLTLNPAVFTEANFADNFQKVVAAFHKYSKRVRPVLLLLRLHLQEIADGDAKTLLACEIIELITKSLVEIGDEFPVS
jgi:hypothetical protein